VVIDSVKELLKIEFHAPTVTRYHMDTGCFVLGFGCHCDLTPLRRLYPLPVRQASILPRASFRFAVTRDTLASG
ncbi:hypothetical protein, partial [Pseudomonas borbori]|uniref:hypothetical protein n=1 Tax=Pseudomonas borbori TaxID=289003 RepID=UPI001FCDEA62